MRVYNLFKPRTQTTMKVLKEITTLAEVKIPSLIEQSVERVGKKPEESPQRRAFSLPGAHVILPLIWEGESVRVTVDGETFTATAVPFGNSCHVTLHGRFLSPGKTAKIELLLPEKKEQEQEDSITKAFTEYQEDLKSKVLKEEQRSR
jgi:hypothetical protein